MYIIYIMIIEIMVAYFMHMYEIYIKLIKKHVYSCSIKNDMFKFKNRIV